MIVGVSGTFCSGKTTIVNELVKRLQNAKAFVEAARVCPYSIKKEPLKAQKWIFNEGIRLCNQEFKGILFVDATVYDNLAYSSLVMSEQELTSLRKVARERARYDLILHLSPLPIVDDGFRHTNEEFQLKIHKLILKELQDYNGMVHRIETTNMSERINKALNIISSANNSFNHSLIKES